MPTCSVLDYLSVLSFYRMVVDEALRGTNRDEAKVGVAGFWGGNRVVVHSVDWIIECI